MKHDDHCFIEKLDGRYLQTQMMKRNRASKKRIHMGAVKKRIMLNCLKAIRDITIVSENSRRATMQKMVNSMIYFRLES